MFVSDKLIYLQMQKTGSSHVTTVMRRYCRGKARDKHTQLVDYQKYRDRLIASSIRNPWDWYVSLWAYGCSASGGFHRYLTQLPQSEIRNAFRDGSASAIAGSLVRAVTQIGRRPDWAALYGDPNNGANFRTWLKLLLGEEGRHITKEGYSSSRINTAVGFMTFRFLALTTEYDAWMAKGRQLQSYAEITAFADGHTIAPRILRMETLNHDLCALLQSVGIAVTLDDLDQISKTNVSTHRKYTDYYDDETYALVGARDRFIIERYGYQMF